MRKKFKTLFYVVSGVALMLSVSCLIMNLSESKRYKNKKKR